MTAVLGHPAVRPRHRSGRRPGTEPVFVVGAPFSGATTLAWALAQHPRLEPALGAEATEALAGALRVLDEDVLPLLGGGGAPSESTGGAGDSARLLVGSVLRAVAGELESAGGRSPARWVASGGDYLTRLQLLSRLFPGLRLVHVLRDADGVVPHLVAHAELDGTTLAPATAELIRRRSVDACLGAEGLLQRDRVLRIHYQELVREPEQALRRCLAFVGERWSPSCVWPLRLLTTERVAVGPSRPAFPELERELAPPTKEGPAAREPGAAVGRLQRGVRRVVESVVPHGATILVASRGDEGLLRFRGRRGLHFPQLAGGVYAGHYPSDGAAAVAHLEELRAGGASHLAFPHAAFWWLEHYGELRRHLEASARLVACETDTCIVWELDPGRPLQLPATLRTPRRVPREPENQRAFRIEHPTPPTKQPRLLGGELWALTAFYNPASYETKSANYARFRRGLAEAGVPLLTVELAFGDAPFELGTGDADQLVQLRGGDVLWQKERLLNIGLTALPEGCDKVAWLDGDVLFARPDWATETARLLDEYVVVQPFSHCVRLPRGAFSCEPATLPAGPGEGELFHGMAWGLWAKGRQSLAHYADHGHTGFAWAARRDVLSRHGLYDANLLGNGDTDIAHAMFGSSEYWGLRKLGAAARAHLRSWAGPFAASVRGSVSHVDGVVTHLWHGSPQHRLYDRPLEVLGSFDPERDLALDPRTGLYRWADASGELRNWSESYFHGRREDGE